MHPLRCFFYLQENPTFCRNMLMKGGLNLNDLQKNMIVGTMLEMVFKLTLLIFMFAGFYIASWYILQILRVPKWLRDFLAGISGLFGFYIWVYYIVG
jgi:hypothetical protein